jgi:hypothetical protein
MQAIGNIKTGFYLCTTCKNSKDIVRVPSTYITNLCCSELYTASWGHTMVCEKIPEDESDNFVDEEKIYEEFQKFNI